MTRTPSFAGSMTFRVDPDLQAAFVAACKANDTPAAQVLRAAMRDYLKAHPQPGLGLDAPAPKVRRKPVKETP